MKYRIVAVRVGPDDRIEAVQLTNHKGEKIWTWSRERVVEAIVTKKHEFFTANTVWSPVGVQRGKWLRSRRDNCEHSNLEKLPRF